MKISEIIVENSAQAGKNFVSKIFSPSQWIGNDPSSQAGKNFVSKIFSPSQWLQSKNTQNSKPNSLQQNNKPADHLDLKNYQAYEIRRNLDSIVAGSFSSDNIRIAQLFYNQLTAGSFNPAIDKEATISSLKKVIDRRPISDSEKEKIKKLKTATKNIA
jgi:hypothetical protein